MVYWVGHDGSDGFCCFYTRWLAARNCEKSTHIKIYRFLFSLFFIAIAICCGLSVSKWHAHSSVARSFRWLYRQHNKWNSKWKMSFVGKYILYILLLVFISRIYMSISYSTSELLFYIYLYAKVPQTIDGSYLRVLSTFIFLSLCRRTMRSKNVWWIHSSENTWRVFYVRLNEWIHTFRSVSLLIGIND